MNKKNKQVSSCCKAELMTHQSAEGTGYYSCKACDMPCNPILEQPESGQKCIVYTGGSHCHCHDKPGVCTSDMTSCNHCSPQNKEEGWNKEVDYIMDHNSPLVGVQYSDSKYKNLRTKEVLKSFISQLREQAFREGQKNGKAAYKGQAVREAYQRGYDEAKAEIKSNVSMLRQWINEDRIRDAGKMVTNDQLEDWLDLSKKEDK